ncbi:MAG TPA: hypothetical protein PK263_02115 [bacterium]|nr:hypothetical protein [bacterium]
MQLPSIDIFIGLIFLVGIAYSFILQREKTITFLCSVYIGLVIAGNFSGTLFEFFNGNKVVANQVWVRSNASSGTIAIIVFLVSIFLVTGAINSRNNRSGGETSLFEVMIYSALAIALILSSVMGFLPEATRNHYIEISKAAQIIYNMKTVWVVLPPIMLVILNWRKSKKN